MTPQESWVLKVFGGQKSFLGPPKTEKIDNLKKPDLCGSIPKV